MYVLREDCSGRSGLQDGAPLVWGRAMAGINGVHHHTVKVLSSILG